MVSIEHADFDGIERIAAVTGGEIASTFDRPELVALGECALIDEIMVRARTQLDPQKHVLASLSGRPWGSIESNASPCFFCSTPLTCLSSPSLSLSLSRMLCCVQVGEDRLIRFSGCKSGSACSIILRGASSHLLDEAGTRPYPLLLQPLSRPLSQPSPWP